MKLFVLLIAAAACASVSCERHDFEETKKLHEHGTHHADDHGEKAPASH